MTTYHWFAGSGRNIALTLTHDEAETGHHQGQCSGDVEWLCLQDHISAQVDTWDQATLADELRDYGAWTAEELEDRAENIHRMVWIACGDIQEDPDFYVEA